MTSPSHGGDPEFESQRAHKSIHIIHMIQESVSVVIPVYNDIEALKMAIPEVLDYLDKHIVDYELIIAEDASIDGSREYAVECSLSNTKIKHFHRENRMGRGSALNQAVKAAFGEIFCYFDVDMATDINSLETLLHSIESGCDIATGSRLLPNSNIKRSINREIKSRGYNFFVRLCLKSSIHDHQCGFKAFRRRSLLSLLPYIKDTHWFWDTEVLVLGQKRGMRITEIPVNWSEGKGTTVKATDTIQMGKSILKLWIDSPL
jgi:glycosyltransferase AglD